LIAHKIPVLNATRHIALNKLPNIEALNLACGAARGELTFWLGVNGSVVSGGEKTAAPPPIAWNPQNDWKQEELLTRDSATIKVPVTTLDEQLAGHPSIALLKIDCEGFEYNIIQGAPELLKKHKPILFIEVHPEPLRHFGQSTEALLKLLDSTYDFEFWHFRLGRHHSKLALSLAKFRRPKAQQWSNAAEMLAAAAGVPGPAQIYWLGRPKS
jgi:FkbM family methyltransferase